MATVVMKYGGSSLATDGQIQAIANHVVTEHRRGVRLVIVVSARGDTTDEIRAGVKSCGGAGVPKEILDFAGLAGEIIDAGCWAGAIEQRGVKTEVADGRRIGLIASGPYGDGRVETIKHPDLITSALDEEKIVVLAAYAGINKEGKILTLGRGGSDTFAVAVAATIQAEVCQIYTDVPGFFAVDPRFVPTAKMFCHLTYWQAMALCSVGVKVLKERCVAIASALNIPVQVLLSPSFDKTVWQRPGVNVDRGTHLSRGATLNKMEATNLDQTGMAVNPDITVFNIFDVPNRPGVSEKIFGAIKEIPLGNVAQSMPEAGKPANVSFYVKSDDATKTQQILSALGLPGSRIERRDDLACLTLVDARMVTESGWIDRATGALAKAAINIEMHPTSGSTILIVVAKSEIKKATMAIAEEFGLCV